MCDSIIGLGRDHAPGTRPAAVIEGFEFCFKMIINCSC